MNDILNLKFYSGKDLYSDGDIEDELLDIVSKYDDYSEVLKKDDRWPILYHLSPIRHNLLQWYDFKENATILEIGAGCGAITGCLCEKAKKVTCVELSKRRSTINATRNKKYNNFEIMVGNFEDVVIEEKFDYVTLIGVLEYAPSYIKSDNPFNEMLDRIKGYLKPDGKVIIAIENRFGIKYFSGAAEDHTGRLFDGINGYIDVSSVRTFSKKELKELLSNVGFVNQEFYYPLPDYKMPNVVYSDYHLPKRGELSNMAYSYDRDRFGFFNENIVNDCFCDAGIMDFFANSFLVIGDMG
ncbi:MAG: class I SAM-dependent methyltransferase [Lachnospiraceae bacterium]|nr:class I SAM-dependent methyltransferase [Lachnospiraceae bacterium]